MLIALTIVGYFLIGLFGVYLWARFIGPDIPELLLVIFFMWPIIGIAFTFVGLGKLLSNFSYWVEKRQDEKNK